MIVNHEIVKGLNPCSDRYENFVKNYPEFDDSVSAFLNLTEISYSDKVWVVTRLIPREFLIKWSIICADSISHLTSDPRVLRCLTYLKTIEDFNVLKPGELELINYHEDATNAAAATAAAYAATYAAYAATAAAYATAYSTAATYAAYAAAYAATAANSRIDQENFNLTALNDIISGDL